MDRYSLDDLIALAAAADTATADRANIASAPRARETACLSMSRLAALASVAGALTPAESAHLAACAACAARRRAFTLRLPAQPPTLKLRRPPALWRTRLTRAVPLAAAAALALLLFPTRPAPPQAPSNSGRTVVAAVPISIRYAPHAANGTSGPQVDCFQSTAHEPCTVLALFRIWNSTCQCLMWELHQWEEGVTLADVASGESLDVRLDVAGSPPVQQLFVLAVARERNDLPGRPEKAEELLECLNHTAPPLGASDDATTYTSAVSACLPAGVTVVPAAFTPR